MRKYDDLPRQFAGNIDTQMPLDGRPAHSKPPMSEQDIADLICFLHTLNDKDTQPADAPAGCGDSPSAGPVKATTAQVAAASAARVDVAPASAAIVNAEQFTAGLTDYLARRGDLCVAKSDWPIDLTQREIDAGARNALQLPVLERLGLARSTVAEVDVRDEREVSHHMKVRRYALTADGRRYYVMREQPRAGGGTERRGDFCAAKLSLDKVVHWDLRGEGKDRRAVVRFTYRVKAAPWTGDAELRRVFPVIAQVIQGAGSAQLQETFRETPTGWVAVDLQ